MIVLLLAFSSVLATENLLNLSVASKINLREYLISVEEVVTFKNRGEDPTGRYAFIVQNEVHSLGCSTPGGQSLQVRTLNSSSFYRYEIDLGHSVAQNHSFTFHCTTLYPWKVKPVFRTRAQDEDQVFQVTINGAFFSPYETVNSTVVLLLRNDTVINDLVVKGGSFQVTTRDGKPHTQAPLRAVFVNNEPFIAAEQLQRTIRVHHLGKIFIEDAVVLRNVGPKLRGPYSTLNSLKGASLALYTHLPAAAEGVKFYDVLGNQSKSEIFDFKTYKTLRWRSRYPLFGGWKYAYFLKYEVPVYEHLYRVSDRFVLRIRSVDYVVSNVVVQKAVVRVVLPEGAQGLGIDRRQNNNTVQFYRKYMGNSEWMSVFGYEVIELKGENLFEDYVETITLDYKYNSLFLLKAPLLIAFYLEVVFVLVIFSNK